MVVENAQFKQALSLIKIIHKMFGKSHTKIVLRYYEQTLSNVSITLQLAFTSLQISLCFTLIFLSEFVVKYPKASSFFWIFLCRNSSSTTTTDSYSFLLKKYLIFVNLCHITLSLNHSIMYAALGAKKLATQKRKLLLSMKTLLLLLTKSPNARKFCFSVCFLSFLFF